MEKAQAPRRSLLDFLRRLDDTNGAVIVETALTLPILAMLMMGMLSYGTWFMAAHGIQQAANEGARAAVGGIDDSDRASLVLDAVTSAIATASAIRASDVTTTETRNGQYYTVTVVYAPARPMWSSFGLVPTPARQIQRQATIRLNSL